MGGLHGCVDSAMDEERIVRAVTTVAPGGAVVLPAPGRDGRSGCW
ncbi:hypothetical protein NX794_20145 [Streptomyces sp. LP11]|uniref:Uncharacterized protein n=1 Tax=Streptomyces pyxinicus TaxID=2970331 RepID=A0ABT2B4R4_9ACTN|nr:hypothetical protein [Streptomyces sp. LP11]MCS0603508.1 hypothetical protein [Streptomyces sp. LP11]